MSYGSAFDDGSIGIRVPLSVERQHVLNLVDTWRAMRHVLTKGSSLNNLSIQASDIGILPGKGVRQMDRLFPDKP